MLEQALSYKKIDQIWENETDPESNLIDLEEESQILEDIMSSESGNIFEAVNYMQEAYKKKVGLPKSKIGLKDGFNLARAAFGTSLKLSGLLFVFEDLAECLE